MKENLQSSWWFICCRLKSARYRNSGTFVSAHFVSFWRYLTFSLGLYGGHAPPLTNSLSARVQAPLPIILPFKLGRQRMWQKLLLAWIGKNELNFFCQWWKREVSLKMFSLSFFKLLNVGVCCWGLFARYCAMMQWALQSACLMLVFRATRAPSWLGSPAGHGWCYYSSAKCEKDERC